MKIKFLFIIFLLLVSAISISVRGESDLPDLTIDFEVTQHNLTHWRFNITIYNEGTTSIPARTPIVWKLASFRRAFIWGKIITMYPFKPGDSLNGIPLGKIITRHKLLCFGQRLTATVDPVYSDDYPWKELNPDPEYGIIVELDENNNKDSHWFLWRQNYTHKLKTNFIFSSKINLRDAYRKISNNSVTCKH
ncbi:MAG: hypothetical protein JSW60_00670 [Thermoplasmatales archaeon]|nr:MAG: hypothetical protein JSW60_00670 [Thermoplasmatales archaeon]